MTNTAIPVVYALAVMTAISMRWPHVGRLIDLLPAETSKRDVLMTRAFYAGEQPVDAAARIVAAIVMHA